MGYGSHRQGMGGIWDALKAARDAATAPAPLPVAPAPVAPSVPVPVAPTQPGVPYVPPTYVPVSPPPPIMMPTVGPALPPLTIPMPPGSTAAGTGTGGTVAQVTQAVTGWLQQPVVLVGLAILGILALRRSGGTRRY